MFDKTSNCYAQGVSKVSGITGCIRAAQAFSFLRDSAKNAWRYAALFLKHCTKMPLAGKPATVGNRFQRQRGVDQQVPCPFQPDIDEKFLDSGSIAGFKDMPQIMLTDADCGGNLPGLPDGAEFIVNYPAGAAGISVRQVVRFRGIVTLPGKFKQRQQQGGSAMIKHRLLQIIHAGSWFSQKSQIGGKAPVIKFLQIVHGAKIIRQIAIHPDMNADIFAGRVHGLGMSLARRMNYPTALSKINCPAVAGANLSASGFMIYDLETGVTVKRASSGAKRIYPSGNESVPQTAGGTERFFSDIFNSHILESHILKSRVINQHNSRFMEYIAILWNCKTGVERLLSLP